ncbi:hypothetical protein QF017_006396, partial [Pseudomonas laurylsulfatiphila]|uniref:hypothetical protein n=1 Tax=Pseudomonas laurylsulfatiphila TaxID=2011015 RepID=UPI003D21D307
MDTATFAGVVDNIPVSLAYPCLGCTLQRFGGGTRVLYVTHEAGRLSWYSTKAWAQRYYSSVCLASVCFWPRVCKNALTSSFWIIDLRWLSDRTVNAAGRI